MIILIGNKADLEAQRDVTYEEAKQFAEENGESSSTKTPAITVSLMFLNVTITDVTNCQNI